MLTKKEVDSFYNGVTFTTSEHIKEYGAKEGMVFFSEETGAMHYLRGDGTWVALSKVKSPEEEKSYMKDYETFYDEMID